MATDQAIMEAVGEGQSPPTLRLYAWIPPCLSLGYAQHAHDVDEDRLQALGWTLVRRPTGGRAILHTDELTYSISLPQDHLLVEGDIVTSYRRLSNALLLALQKLGLEAASNRHTPPDQLGAICFETPSDYEITVNHRKLIGSAQVRRHKAVLQHGSIPLYGDITRICEVLAYPNELSRIEAREQVFARATTIERELNHRVDWETAADALQSAFSEVFSIHFSPDFLTPAESIRLEQLRGEIYGSDVWTYKR